MKLNRHFFITAVLLVIVSVSCSKYSKVYKSTDNDLKYRAAVEYYEGKKYDKALNLLLAVEPYYMGSDREDTVVFYSAMCYFRKGEFITSGELFSEFRRKFITSPFMEEAEYLIAMGYYYDSPAPNRDQTSTKRALAAFNEFLDRYPNTPKKEQIYENITELISKLYEKELLNAYVYYNIEYYKAAIHTLKVSLADYPDTEFREEILYLITKAGYLYASNSIESMKMERYLGMMDGYYNLISEYPETKHLKEVTKMYDDAQKYIKKKGGKDDASSEENKQ